MFNNFLNIKVMLDGWCIIGNNLSKAEAREIWKVSICDIFM